MKMSPQDFQKLKLPLVTLAVALISMTLLFYITDTKKAEAARLLKQQEDMYMQAKQKFETSGQEKETIINFLPKYQKLISDGFVGEERRIEWVDSLRNIHQQQKLFSINYSIGMQEDYKPTFNLPTGALTLRRSVMKLELSMLHEGDLLTLIDALRKYQTSTFILRDCEINRQNATVTNTLVPNMLASCNLDWLTIKEPQITTQ